MRKVRKVSYGVCAVSLAGLLVAAALVNFSDEAVYVNLLTGGAELIIAVTVVASLVSWWDRRKREREWSRTCEALRQYAFHQLGLTCQRLWRVLRGGNPPDQAGV